MTLRGLVCLIFAVTLQMISAPVFAQATCTGAAQTVSIPMPASLDVPNNSAVGTLLTNPATATVSSAFNCNVPFAATVAIAFQPVGLSTAMAAGAPMTVSVSGVTLTVYQTNVSGVGIAIAVRPLISGCPIYLASPPLDLGGNSQGFPVPWTGMACPETGIRMANGAQVTAVLVKTGPISAGMVTNGIIVQAASFIQNTLGAPLTMQTGSRAPGLISFSLTPVKAPVHSCQTPDVTVPMGTYLTTSFRSVGSTTLAVDFNLQFINCAQGVTAIQYQFSAANGIAIPSRGVINLSADSTAKGIGLQLLDKSNVPLQLNTIYNVAAVNGSSSSYTVPFKAAYYQVETAVLPGTANANVTFTIDYP